MSESRFGVLSIESPLQLESHYNKVGRSGWCAPVTKNGVCVVNTCTELLMANSIIG